jgi:hypothetical protein
MGVEPADRAAEALFSSWIVRIQAMTQATANKKNVVVPIATPMVIALLIASASDGKQAE